jgi:hypothetical protein
MSKVPLYIRRNHREKLKDYNNDLREILDNCFKESRDIVNLTNDEIRLVKNFNINSLDDLNYFNINIKEGHKIFYKLVAKVLIRLMRLDILTEDDVRKIYETNIVLHNISIMYRPFSLEFKLILLNLIFEIKECNVDDYIEMVSFGIKVNFVIGKGKKNIILYGSKYFSCNHKTVFIINDLKIFDNYKLFDIINKYKNLEFK